ncbi:unnamed protein product [Orchesella dallaii]|uniref:Uncharacterized protein n=1 Tax=Orchesella dallaii TaxID=48710 RepID=A0ABP1PXW3_9HEXA
MSTGEETWNSNCASKSCSSGRCRCYYMSIYNGLLCHHIEAREGRRIVDVSHSQTSTPTQAAFGTGACTPTCAATVLFCTLPGGSIPPFIPRFRHHLFQILGRTQS